jgi:hypothetical protein
MKQVTKNRLISFAGLALALPAAYFISISILKFGLGVDGPYDASEPLLVKMGLKQSLGWNINLLILFGPIAAFFLAIFQVLKFEWKFGREHFYFQFTIKKKLLPLLVVAFSVSVLAVLFIYIVGENCR